MDTNYIQQIEQYQAEIRALKQLLYNTDYIAAKIAEGAATKDEYSSQIVNRQSWRQKINEYETMIASIQDNMQNK